VVVVPICLFLVVPCCCPNSNLALWIYLQKEKLKQGRTTGQMIKRKDKVQSV